MGHEIAECGAIRGEVIRQQREVGEPAPARGDLPPAMRQAATEIVERDDLEIASVRERDQRVARQTVSVLAAWGDGEAAPPVVVHRGREVAGDHDHVIELAEHWANV